MHFYDWLKPKDADQTSNLPEVVPKPKTKSRHC